MTSEQMCVTSLEVSNGNQKKKKILAFINLSLKTSKKTLFRSRGHIPVKNMKSTEVYVLNAKTQ